MSTAMIVACPLIVVILLILIEKLKNQKVRELLKQFPSYPTYPLIGNLLMLWGSSEDMLARMMKMMSPYDRLVFWIGPVPCLVLKKHEDIMAMLQQSSHRETLNFLKEWLGIGMITAEPIEWKKSRKSLAPAFSWEMLVKYTNTFNSNALKLVENLKPVANQGEIVDVWEYIATANVSSIMTNSLGLSIEEAGNEAKNYCKAVLQIFENVTKRIATPWLHPHVIYMTYLKVTGKIQTINRLKKLPTKVLADKKGLQNATNKLPHEDSSFNPMINLLINKSSKEPSFNDARITDEMVQMIATGAETTAVNVCFTLLMLAMHQNIQQKVYEEVTQLMSENETLTAAQSAHNLKYLEQCVKETARMYSSSVAAFRRTQKDCLLNDNKIVPRNMFVVACLHFVHFDPELYENPFKWDPEHFSDQAVSKRPKSSDLIFGYGPRWCIGAKYAIMSAKTQIAHIIRNYHLSTNVKELTNDDLKADLCVRSKLGYPIKFTSRHKADK